MSDDHLYAPLDLDRLSRLAADDPAAFEAERQRLVEGLIESAPRRQRLRLRGLQWRVDNIRARSATPMVACRRISVMMWDRIVERGGLLDAMDALHGDVSAGKLRAQGQGTVLHFKPPPGDGT